MREVLPQSIVEYLLLDRITSPHDVKTLSAGELKRLAQEIRKRIIDVVSKNGGHLGGPLGAVELSIALHYVFDSPRDKIVWDVGHQAYAHKLLTGRNSSFDTLRTYQGISGFVKPQESEHDAFGVGHSSTSISAALGMVVARDLRGEHHKVIAVIGDGGLTAGMAYEALNQAGELQKDLLIILNDNRMSINPNVGAISQYLQRLVLHPQYHTLRKKTRYLVRKLPKIGDTAVQTTHDLAQQLKKMLIPTTLFEEFGLRYFGPVDGHNLGELIQALKNIKDMKGPIVLHVLTEKGKGYDHAEKDGETRLHGVSPFHIGNGISPTKNYTFTEAFSRAMCDVAREDSDIVAITPAMKKGSGLTAFAEEFPSRFFDVGIAEQHAVSFAGGLAIQGMKPVCALYSTFFQRAYDQFVHDICLQNLPVTFAIDRAGIVGEDGPTHHGPFDIAAMRAIPNICMMVPRDEFELRTMLFTAVNRDGPTAIRFPKGTVAKSDHSSFQKIPIGKSQMLKRGNDITFLAVGPLVDDALAAAVTLSELGVSAEVINARFIKPLDVKAILQSVRKTKHLLTIEDGTLCGGFGSAVLESLPSSLSRSLNVARLGVPDEFIEQGSMKILKTKMGLSAESIIKTTMSMLQ